MLVLQVSMLVSLLLYQLPIAMIQKIVNYIYGMVQHIHISQTSLEVKGYKEKLDLLVLRVMWVYRELNEYKVSKVIRETLDYKEYKELKETQECKGTLVLQVFRVLKVISETLVYKVNREYKGLKVINDSLVQLVLQELKESREYKVLHEPKVMLVM